MPDFCFQRFLRHQVFQDGLLDIRCIKHSLVKLVTEALAHLIHTVTQRLIKFLLRDILPCDFGHRRFVITANVTGNAD